MLRTRTNQKQDGNWTQRPISGGKSEEKGWIRGTFGTAGGAGTDLLDAGGYAAPPAGNAAGSEAGIVKCSHDVRRREFRAALGHGAGSDKRGLRSNNYFLKSLVKLF